MRNRKGDVLIEIDKIELKKMGISPMFNNYNSNENIQIMPLTFISVIESIKKCESLTYDQIKEIFVILFELEECKKDKVKVWVNIKQVLMWLADKAVDVGISVLPYVTGILSI